MRKRVAALILLTGLNVLFCNGQERSIPTFTTNEESNTPVKQLKDVLKQIQETYKVNLLFETKLEGLTTTYGINPGRDLDQVFRELLTPLQLTSVKLNAKNYVIKSDQTFSLTASQPSTFISRRPADESESSERQPNSMEKEGVNYNIPPVEIMGTVVDENGKPVVGATILIKGTKIGCKADAAGNFSLKIPEEYAPVLMISAVGMNFQEINVKNKAFIRVSMLRSEHLNEEIVVVGYGKQQKKDVVTAVSTIKAEDIVQENAVNLGNALQGKVNGAVIISRSGTPGNSRPYIMIRGNNPKFAPLIVIDGVPRYQDQGNDLASAGGLVNLNGLTLDDINPDEVASISVLKDNAATAVYGTRGAGGVILIETKRGSIGRPKFSFSTSYSIDNPARFPKLLDGYHYAIVTNEQAVNDGRTPSYNDSVLNVIRYGLDPYKWANTDLYHLLVQRHATVQSNSLSVSGGTDQVRYYINGSLTNQGGIIDAYNYKRYTVQSNLDIKLSDELKLAVNTGFVNSVINGATTAADGQFAQILLNSPLTPTYNRDGSWYSLGGNANRLANILPDQSGYQRNTGNNITVQANLQYAPAFLKGFTFRLNNNINYNAGTYTFLQKFYDAYKPDPSSPTGYVKTGGTSGYTAPSSNKLTQNVGTGISYNTDYGFDYTTKIRRHNIAVTALGTHYYYTSNQVTATRDGILDGLEAINFGRKSTAQATGGTTSEAGRVGGVLRVGYNYDSKYYMEYSMRADASDNFPPGHKWGYFPGGSLAWRMSQERFIRRALPFVQDLKMRVSMGLTGIDEASAYNYFYGYTVATSGNSGGAGYAFGGTYQPSFVLGSSNIPNANLTWGQSLMRNVGLDFTLWKGLLSGTFDVYDKNLSRIQIPLNATIPATFGIGGPNYNSGKQFYSGYEASLANNLKLGKDMSLQTAVNLTYTYSRMVDNAEAANTPDYLKKQGHSIGARSFYQAIGIFQTQDEINKYPIKQDATNNSTIKPGDIKYADLNGDGKIDINDQDVWYDNTNLPPYSAGLNMTYRYKAFSVNVFFQGAFGNWIQFQPGSFTQYGYDNSWRPTNPNALYPRIANNGQLNNDPRNKPNTLYLRKGDYARFKNLKFAYSVPEKLIKKVGLSNVTVSAAALNLTAFSKLKDVDPEAANVNIDSGGYYPVQRNYSVSLNIGF
jgi:TonB-linked SusC/RagA family outer membrane protein